MRCMFCKEFFFDEILQLWDFIFMWKLSSGLVMMDFVALGMIIWARDAGG